jgi:hypothetical protein
MSELIIDKLTGKTNSTNMTIGSTPIVSSSANSMSIRGEGSNTVDIQQGLCKAWCQFKGTGTVAINNSFNFSSMSDVATGNYTLSFTNPMGNAEYSIQAFDKMWGRGWADSDSTTAFATRRVTNANAYLDVAEIWHAIHGDLS